MIPGSFRVAFPASSPNLRSGRYAVVAAVHRTNATEMIAASEQDAEQADLRSSVLSVTSMRELYLAERQRRQSVRSQLAIPVSIVSFSIFGFVSFAEHFKPMQGDLLTWIMDLLSIASVLFLFAAMYYLGRVEVLFMRVEMEDFEDLRDASDEQEYFRDAYFRARGENAAAANHRARAFILLLLALGFFVANVAMLPFHLSATGA